KSTDAAANWNASDAGLTATAVTALAADPSNANVVYAGTFSGVYKSTDGGANWQLTGQSRPSTAPLNTFAVAVDPANPNVVYAGTFGGGVIYKSTDGGALYDIKNSGSFAPIVDTIIAVPTAPTTTLYAGTTLGGVIKSTDGAESWTQVNNGLGDVATVSELVYDPTNTNVIYAGTSGGVAKTTNGGASWTFLNLGTGFGTPRVTALAIDPSNPSTLYAGTTFGPASLYKTTNGGSSWSASANGLTFSVGPGQNLLLTVNALSISPAAPAVVYAATTTGGMFKSTDGGANWAAANAGLQNANALAVLAHPANAANVLAGFNIGSDGFAGRLNAAGSQPVYFRYLGGAENDEARGVAVDAAGNAYLVGTTASNDFPVANAFQPTKSIAFSDAFVTKLSPDGTTLVYSSFLGGSSTEAGRAVAVNAQGQAHLTGQTFSNNFPLATPLDSTPGLGSEAFVTKLSADGSALLFSTYFGGNGAELGTGIAVDAQNNVYVTGSTSSPVDFLLVEPTQSVYGGATDGFLARFDFGASLLDFSTYIGGSASDVANAVAVDAAGSAYVAGTTSSFNFPTANPLQPSLRAQDAFVAKFGANADLAVTKRDSRDPVMVNNSLTYTLSVTNHGPDPASNARVTDTLPAGIAFVSATPSQGTCGGTATVTCDLGTLASGATATVFVVVTPSVPGATLSNTAGVTSDTPDLDASDNSATQETRVSAQPSIAGRITTVTTGPFGGQVVPLGGVTVTLSGSQSATAQTDADGRYQFADLAQGGSYTVTPARAGFVFNPDSHTFANLTADATGDFVAVGCTFTITPANRSFPAGGGAGTVNVAATDPRCPRTATSNAPWIDVTSGASANGSGAVGFTVAPTNSSRTGTLNIAGRVFTVWQELSPCGAISFIDAPRFSADPAPVFVERGDFNNDGKPDLAVLNDIVSNVTQTSRVSVLTGTGAGGFDAPRSVNLGGTPRALALADFNNDGKLDVVAIIFGQANNIQVLLGDGAGNLGAPATFSAGGLPVSIAVGDFNGDGKADLAVANEDSHNVSILLGTGLGTFGTASHIGNSILHAARRVVVGDFNEDGKPDLFVQGSFMSVMRGNGDGTFAAPVQLGGTLLGAVVVGDFNEDGNLDLVGWNGNFGVNLLPGDGAGGFGAPVTSQTGGRQPGRLIGTDINGDGHLDLAAANHSFQGTHDVNALLGNGAGSFTPGP
ncbi:MAG TPA: FG-GAP-like repeat-containing protein, partial [Pyrinomonadaceae bacterium]